MDKFLTIGLGGFLGANARYIMGGWVAERFGATFSFGTMAINVSGSFPTGLFMTLAVDRWAELDRARTSPSLSSGPGGPGSGARFGQSARSPCRDRSCRAGCQTHH